MKLFLSDQHKCKQENLCGVMATVFDCCLRISKFEHQLYYYDYFQINTTRKGIEPHIPHKL